MIMASKKKAHKKIRQSKGKAGAAPRARRQVASASKKRRVIRKKAASKRKPATATARPTPKKRRRLRKESAKPTAEQMAEQQREISVSEFFTKNRHLLGFDNPRKALLTVVREGVDNALDACEEAGILPEVRVAIRPVDSAEDRFRVIVEDNGPGIVPAQVPKIFAKLLYGSKFHRLKMSRGQQGIGISAAGMYGQLTTGKPTRIISRTSPRKPAYQCDLLLNTRTNQPQVVREHEAEWQPPHGTRVEIELEARYSRGRQSVEEYLHQVSIANPHATIIFEAPQMLPIHLERAASELPPEPREIKPHPCGIELGMLVRMLHSTRARRLSAFLQQDFSRVSARVAAEICAQAKLKEDTRPARIAKSQADRLHQALQAAKLMKPPTDCIVPIGEELLLKGLRRGVNADFYHTVTRLPSVYRGNPFQVEVGIAYGGDLPADRTCRVMRFANRVPLLYQQSACAATRTVATTTWRNYGIRQSQGQLPVGPMTVAIHVASVWVPFTSESKEAVAHYPEILKEIKLALQGCGRQLSRFVRRRRREADAAKKRQYIERYIPHIGAALKEILSLSDRQEARVVNRLQDLLERSRKM